MCGGTRPGPRDRKEVLQPGSPKSRGGETVWTFLWRGSREGGGRGSRVGVPLLSAVRARRRRCRQGRGALTVCRLCPEGEVSTGRESGPWRRIEESGIRQCSHDPPGVLVSEDPASDLHSNEREGARG